MGDASLGIAGGGADGGKATGSDDGGAGKGDGGGQHASDDKGTGGGKGSGEGDDKGSGGSLGIAGGGAKGAAQDGDDPAGEGGKDAKGDGDGDGSGDGGMLGVPDGGYQDFKVPEGAAVDEGMMTFAKEGFKELGLSQDGGQKMVEMFAGVMKQADAVLEQQAEKVVGDWQNEIVNDPVWGGKNLDQAREFVDTAMRELFKDDPYDTLKWLSESKVEFHPGLRRAFAVMGKRLADDTFDGAGRKAAENLEPKGLAERWYPKLAKE